MSMTEKRRAQKDEVVRAYLNKKISRKVAAARMRDLKFDPWEVALYLDNDQTGPE
jgi:hypothetical protein